MALFVRRMLMLVWCVVTSPVALVLLIPVLGIWVSDGCWFTEPYTEILCWKWPA